MAVYTHVAAEALADFLAGYDLGELLAAKGIAEGVSNSNYLLDTTTGRFILTLYEARTDPADLPWFIDLMNRLADAGLPVPRPAADRSGRMLNHLAGRPAALIAFASGVSVGAPTAAQCRAVGQALARVHGVAAPHRANGLGQPAWAAMAAALGERLDGIAPGLAADIAAETAFLHARWPLGLPGATIHADLFPDNVLMSGARVTALIDWYFACTDLAAYDLAVTETAWAFDGDDFAPARAAALREGYESVRPISPAERAAHPLLARGACLRFFLTRAQDWLDRPAGALVTAKDPMIYHRRLAHYRG